MDCLYIPVIILHLSIVAKTYSIAKITQLRSLELLTAKTPLLYMLYYMNWLTHDFWTRTGGWEFDHSHGASTSSPSHWQQVGEQAPKPVGWMVCFLLMTFVPVQKLCVIIYICKYSLSLWVLFSYTRMLVTFGICFRQHFDTRYLVFYNPSPPKMWPWTFFQNIGFNIVPSGPFMSHLATQLGYSAVEFQTLQPIVLATFGVVD